MNGKCLKGRLQRAVPLFLIFWLLFQGPGLNKLPSTISRFPRFLLVYCTPPTVLHSSFLVFSFPFLSFPFLLYLSSEVSVHVDSLMILMIINIKMMIIITVV